jgi:mannose-6-phosphate isomerase
MHDEKHTAHTSMSQLQGHYNPQSGFVAKHTVEKPWGKEEWLVQVPGTYAAKLLHVKAGELLSVQFHPRKTETLSVISGDCELLLGPQGDTDHTKAGWQPFKVGDVVHINPHTVHTFKARSDVLLLEVSTDHLEPHDTVRITDKYNRSTGTY